MVRSAHLDLLKGIYAHKDSIHERVHDFSVGVFSPVGAARYVHVLDDLRSNQR
jgi:hypothetical protein